MEISLKNAQIEVKEVNLEEEKKKARFDIHPKLFRTPKKEIANKSRRLTIGANPVKTPIVSKYGEKPNSKFHLPSKLGKSERKLSSGNPTTIIPHTKQSK